VSNAIVMTENMLMFHARDLCESIS